MEKEPIIHPLSFSVLKKEEVTSEEGEIEQWGDIPVSITVEVGRKTRLVKDIVNIKEGEIIELDKFVSEPFDILANGRIIARGQAVIINDKLGIRVTELINE